MRAGIGLRVKTGYASAIALRGPVDAPLFAERAHVLLADLDDDDSRQPYHAALDRGERVGATVVARARKDAERRAKDALETLVVSLARRRARPRAVGLVVGSETDPESIANPHIRAHALEGRFYRDILATAAKALGLEVLTLLERHAHVHAARALELGQARLRATVLSIGAAAGRPWRVDERLATLAAWLALAGER